MNPTEQSGRPRRQPGRGGLIIAAGITVAIIGATLAVTAEEPIEPGVVVGELEQTAYDEDRLPSPAVYGQLENVVPESTRLVFDSGDAHYWLGTSIHGEICGIIFLRESSEHWILAAGCSDTSQFAHRGLPLDVTTPNESRSARFIPDGLLQIEENMAAIQQAGAIAAAPNLIILPQGVQDIGLPLVNNDGQVVEVGSEMLPGEPR